MARTVALLIVVMLTAFGAIRSIAAPDEPPDLTGIYECKGTNPDGTDYKGVVAIDRVRETFRIRWGLPDGMVTGVGIFSNGVLSVSYYGGAPAVVVYRVEGNQLVGRWAMAGAEEGMIFAETLTKVNAIPRDRRDRSKPGEQPVHYEARR
jgi:hypothetical protein